MSSILNALKKLERESPQEARDVFPNNPVPGAGMPQPPLFHWGIRIGGLALLLLLAAGTGMWISHAPENIPESPAPEIARFRVPDPPIPVPLARKPAAAPASPSMPSESPGPKAAHVSGPMAGLRTPKSGESTVRTGEFAKTPPAETAHPTAPSSQPPPPGPARASAPPSPEPAKPPMRLPETPPVFPLLADVNVHLQAVAWSSRVEKRMAVINGSIVREGDAVNGYTLERINRDDIILRKGPRSWVLPFRVR